jgi:hypothetical protein
MSAEMTTSLPIKSDPLLPKKYIIPLAFCLGGIGWRLRGDGSLGGMFGMFFVGALFSLLFFGIWNKNPRFSLGTVSFLGILLALTTHGYGTFIGQLTGRFASSGSGTSFEIAVPVYYGWMWLLITGLSWAPLFAGMLGLLFSSKAFTFRDIIIMVIVYGIVYGLGILALSHLLIPIISPISTTFFQESITNLGETPWSIYIKNLINTAELEPIPGGRNYVSQITNLSGVLGLLGIILWLGLIKKNAQATKIAMVISVIFGFSMTIAGIWQFIGRGGVYTIGVGAAFTPPEWIRLDGWGLWEFFTGSIACGLTVMYLRHLPFETLPTDPIDYLAGSSGLCLIISLKQVLLWCFYYAFVKNGHFRMYGWF